MVWLPDQEQEEIWLPDHRLAGRAWLPSSLPSMVSWVGVQFQLWGDPLSSIPGWNFLARQVATTPLEGLWGVAVHVLCSGWRRLESLLSCHRSRRFLLLLAEEGLFLFFLPCLTFCPSHGLHGLVGENS